LEESESMLLPDVTTAPLALALAVTLTAQSPSGSFEVASLPPDPTVEIAQGVAAFSARQPDLALRHFEAALAVDSTSYEANWRAALALITLGLETPDSVKSPERDSLFFRAERDARRAVAADSLGADGHFLLARALGQTALTKGKQERIRLAGEIRQEAVRAIQLNPRHDGAYHVLGRWNAEVMRQSGFSRFFARSFLGGGALGQASWDSAITNLEHAVQLDSTRITHRLDLARIFIDRKRYSDARAQLEAVQKLPVRDFEDPRYKQDAAALLRKIADKADKKDRS
jgi:tetratricopeptide (TPR) repeat protein